MRTISVLTIFLLSSMCLAMPQLVFTIRKEQTETGSVLRIIAAGNAPDVPFAIPEALFLDKSVAEGFEKFGKDTVSLIEKFIEETLKGSSETLTLTYLNPVDSNFYRAELMRMSHANGEKLVNIFVYPVLIDDSLQK